MNRKRICCLFCFISIIGLIASTMIVVSLNSAEIIRDVEIQNSDGSKGTVFVVFRPGLTSFNEDVVNGFIRGLVDSDWRVEVTTSSQQTPTNVTNYDLIVLGSPVNGDQPHQSMQDYLTRVDFDGKPVLLILTSAGGPTETAIGRFRNATLNANGLVLNELQFGILETDAIDRAYTAGTEISLA
jgi:flavorubredoxin